MPMCSVHASPHNKPQIDGVYAAGMDVDDVQAVLAKSRQLLHDKRIERPRPHLDDKVWHTTQHAVRHGQRLRGIACESLLSHQNNHWCGP